MSIIRIVHNRENPYVQLNKEALWDKNLSLKACGLWARCMSRPDDWRFSIKELASKSKEGRRAIDGAIKELIEAGYAVRLEYYEKSEDGKFNNGGFEYVFFEFPATQQDKDKVLEEFKKSFRHCGFSNIGNRIRRNSTLLRKEEEQIKKEATKERSACAPPPQPFSKKRITIKEAKEAKAVRIAVTPTQHASLLKKANDDEALVKAWYDRLSEWKVKKEIDGGNDYATILNWVIKAVEEDKTKPKDKPQTNESDLNDVQKNNWRLNQELVQELKIECPDKCGGLNFYYKCHLLKDRNNRDFDLSGLISHADFCRQLDKKYDLRTYEVRIVNEKLQ